MRPVSGPSPLLQILDLHSSADAMDSLPNMAAAALESFPTGSPSDQVLLILLPAGHSVCLSLALLQKVSECRLDLRPVQIPLADAEEGAPAVLTPPYHRQDVHTAQGRAVCQKPRLSRPSSCSRSVQRPVPLTVLGGPTAICSGPSSLPRASGPTSWQSSTSSHSSLESVSRSWRPVHSWRWHVWKPSSAIRTV